MDLELKLPSVPPAVRAARHVIDGLADQLAEDVVERFRLVVSELVTNSVRHAPRPSRPINVRAHISESVIRIEVIDGGISVPMQPPLLEWESGWGLFLVDQLTDRWGTKAGRGRGGVWCEFDLAAGQAGTQTGGSGGSTPMLRLNVA